MPEQTSRNPEAREADLLAEAGIFMRIASGVLRSLIQPARSLRHGLAQTGAYKRVDGDDAAQDEPVWDLAGTLEVMLEEDLERMADYLRRGARRAAAAATARRTGSR